MIKTLKNKAKILQVLNYLAFSQTDKEISEMKAYKSPGELSKLSHKFPEWKNLKRNLQQKIIKNHIELILLIFF